MACADVDMSIQSEQPPRRPNRPRPLPSSPPSAESSSSPSPPSPPSPVVHQYEPTDLIPWDKGPLGELLKKQPAVLGSLQIVSGFLSFSIGILFVITQNIEQSLCTLFRVSHLTGTLFIIAGIISNMLFKHPELLPVSLWVNGGSIIVSVIAAILISVDLAFWDSDNSMFMKMEVLALCVLGLEVFLSAVLCAWFTKEGKKKCNKKSP